MKRLVIFAVSMVLALGAGSASAQVRVTKGAGSKTYLDWTGLRTAQTAAGATFRKTLDEDLVRSGWFLPAPAGRGEFVVQGSCDDSGAQLDAKCMVYETATRRNCLGKSYTAASGDARRLAHQMANDIISAVTGKKGLFSGRLAVIGNRSGKKEIYLCDPDGQNVIQLTHDNSISLAPKWGPDGRTLVYTSYLKRYPDVYLIDVSSGSRKRIAGYPGLNTGPEISPNGREVALILSKDGNPDLYIKRLDSDQLTRVTKTLRAAEASPSWSPDGSQIVYVSDQAGTPQLYIVSRDGGAPRRMTSRNLENVAPDWGANGLITFSTRVGGRYQVCALDPASGQITQLTSDGADYEDPCWAPDGRHIACSRTVGYRAAIYLLDTLGDPPVALLEIKGDWYSPSWTSK